MQSPVLVLKDSLKRESGTKVHHGNIQASKIVYSTFDMESAAEAEYAAFLEKVGRTVYVDNLSPHITESILRTAFNQYGLVKSIQIIHDYLEPKNTACCALVEMRDAKQAAAVISMLTQYPFMVSGMPRPVKARAAEADMFDDRPIKPGRRIQCRWLNSKDPDFAVAKKMKDLCWKHNAETSFLLERQLAREEKLHMQQWKTLKANRRKLDMIEDITRDGTVSKLADYYGVRVMEH